MTRQLAPLAMIALLAACGDKGKDDSGTTPANPCSDMGTVANDVVSTSLTFSFTTEEAGTPTILLDLEGEQTTLTSTTSGTDHSIVSQALVAGGDYTWTATLATDSGTIECDPQTVKVSPPPGVMMNFDLNLSEAGSAVADGYLVISMIQADTAWVAMVDGQGRFRFFRGTDDPTYTIAHSRIGRDGSSILYNQFDQARVLDVGNVRRVSFDGTVNTTTRTFLGHHDFVELPDSSFGWLGYDRRDFAMDAGSAPPAAEFNLNCPGGICPIAGEIVLEGEEGITQDNESVEVLNLWDDWTTDPWWVCDHMWDFDSFVPDYYEWMHANSMAYVDSEDAYYVMSRYTDRMFKIDRVSGQILWQMGGPDSDFVLNSGEWFDHGHMSDVWEGGFLIFDNGDHRGLTRVSEYSWDENTMTAERVWSMDHPTGQMLPILGDVKRLPNGNRLIVWSADALVQEITPTGDVVWELQSATGGFGVVARADFVESVPAQP